MKDKNGMNHDEHNGQFTSGESTVAEQERANELTGNKMTPADKIASVHIERGKDNILPELNEGDLAKIGVTNNKPVLVKASITERNAARHPDIDDEETDKIIGEALYNPAKIFKGNKETYHHFAQVVRLSSKGTDEPRFGAVLLDVNETLDNFEVVHWHLMIPQELERAEKKNK